jgi:hypothetical protein
MGRFDPSSNTLYDAPADCQTKPASSLSAASRLIHTVQSVK